MASDITNFSRQHLASALDPAHAATAVEKSHTDRINVETRYDFNLHRFTTKGCARGKQENGDR